MNLPIDVFHLPLGIAHLLLGLFNMMLMTGFGVRHRLLY